MSRFQFLWRDVSKWKHILLEVWNLGNFDSHSVAVIGVFFSSLKFRIPSHILGKLISKKYDVSNGYRGGWFLPRFITFFFNVKVKSITVFRFYLILNSSTVQIKYKNLICRLYIRIFKGLKLKYSDSLIKTVNIQEYLYLHWLIIWLIYR